MASLGERIRFFRRRFNLTQKELADRIQVTKSAISMYERDEREPSLEALDRMCAVFGIDLTHLVGTPERDVLGSVFDYFKSLPRSEIFRMMSELEASKGQKSHAQDDKSPIKLSENERTMKIQPGTGWNFNKSEKVIHMALEQMKRENVSNVDDDIKMIPVLGTIKAGYDLYAEQQVIDMQPVAASTVSDGAEYFYLLVKGDSMIGEGIREGMRVLVRRQEYVEDGKIGVVLLNGDEATLKRVITRENEIMLLSANENYPPRTVPKDYARIQGQVKQVVWDV